jgi:hypothetical protein
MPWTFSASARAPALLPCRGPPRTQKRRRQLGRGCAERAGSGSGGLRAEERGPRKEAAGAGDGGGEPGKGAAWRSS